MRFFSLLLPLILMLSACSSSLNTRTAEDTTHVDSNNQFKELDSILASHVKSRDLIQANNLIKQLKLSLPKNHSRQKELLVLDQWVNESISHRKKTRALEKQSRSLKTKITQHKKALEQVRRSLVSE